MTTTTTNIDGRYYYLWFEDLDELERAKIIMMEIPGITFQINGRKMKLNYKLKNILDQNNIKYLEINSYIWCT